MKMSNQQKVQTKANPKRSKKRKDMSLEERLQLLQRKLYFKAKQDKAYRFYILYDKIFLDYVLQEAYKQAKRSGGSPGIDRQSFAEIDKEGIDEFLKDLKEDLRKRTYRPKPVKRVWIDKEDGSKRPLGIPTIRDRVAQTACKMIIEPLFETVHMDLDQSIQHTMPSDKLKSILRQAKRKCMMPTLASTLIPYRMTS
jgi:retron-type reverse transcriptase